MENADRQSQDIETSNGSSSKSGDAYPVNRLYKSKASGGTIKRNYPAGQSPSVNSQVKIVIAVVVQATWQMIAQLRKERSVITVKKLDILLRCVNQSHRDLVK